MKQHKAARDFSLMIDSLAPWVLEHSVARMSHSSNGQPDLGIYSRVMSLTPAFHRPSPHLAPYVAYFFSLEAPAGKAGESAHAVQVLPVPHIQLVFSFGDESFERRMGGAIVRSPGFAVTGYTTSTVEYLNRGRLGVLMAGLQPWGLRALLASALPIVLDRNIDLRELFGGVDELDAALRAASADEDRLRLVEAFLTRNLRAPSIDETVEQSVARITTARGNVSVQSLADNAGLSRRQFLRRFRDTVGIEPRLYSQLVRFQATFEAMDAQRGAPNWTDIALSAGYYDQSHFINAFRAFTGLSPTEYVRCLTRTESGLTFDAHVREGDPVRRMYL